MEARSEKNAAPKPLRSQDPNPFYLNTSYSGGTHYLVAEASQLPFLFTTEITACVGIGLYYWREGKVKKFGLYHSYSEHSYCDDKLVVETLGTPFVRRFCEVDSKNLIRAIYNFLFDIDDVENVRVIIHNKEFEIENVNYPDENLAFDQVMTMVNQVSRLMGKREIERRNFLYSQGSTTFCVMNDGSYFALLVDGSEDETIARKVAMYIHDDIAELNREPGMFKGRKVRFFDGHQDKVTIRDKYILNCLNQARDGRILWVDACLLISHELRKIPEKDKKLLESYQKIRFMLDFLDNALIFARHETLRCQSVPEISNN
ncbi:hypothetical protein AQUSIP_07380 [Aquicella siphonis]|uniref:Uncharacterized protein n=1 Tax=Aquicella siphonis TaxID=254247 RepID=A0A5E4PG15_9COXI|nr:hypothetical protein [Aquicella siphonis]VVC75448.1 hypothetical protein AQUSIP_07380 [Aquicella siphonis]